MLVNRQSFFASLLTLVVCLLPGCGGADYPDRGNVTGKVTMNGQPVPGVSVMASPAKGRTTFGVAGDDGTYQLMYTIDVSGTELGPNKISLIWPTGVSGPAIPKEYIDMELNVVAGNNTFDIAMESEAPAWKSFSPVAGETPEAASTPSKGKKKAMGPAD